MGPVWALFYVENQGRCVILGLTLLVVQSAERKARDVDG